MILGEIAPVILWHSFTINVRAGNLSAIGSFPINAQQFCSSDGVVIRVGVFTPWRFHRHAIEMLTHQTLVLVANHFLRRFGRKGHHCRWGDFALALFLEVDILCQPSNGFTQWHRSHSICCSFKLERRLTHCHSLGNCCSSSWIEEGCCSCVVSVPAAETFIRTRWSSCCLASLVVFCGSHTLTCQFAETTSFGVQDAQHAVGSLGRPAWCQALLNLFRLTNNAAFSRVKGNLVVKSQLLSLFATLCCQLEFSFGLVSNPMLALTTHVGVVNNNTMSPLFTGVDHP